MAVAPAQPPAASGYFRLSNDGRAKAEALGPMVTDGRSLYLVEGSGSLPVIAQIPITGGETKILSTPLALPELLDVSTSKAELMLMNYTHGLRSPVWRMQVPEGIAQPLDVRGTAAAYSPDGRSIAFVKDRILYRANNDGSAAQQLANLPGTAFWLRWSPDGRHLRMTIGNVFDKTGALSIWDIAVNGSGLRRLFPDWNQPPTACCGNWTPDGKCFVFQAVRNGRTDIWATREHRSFRGWLATNAGEPVQLTLGQLDSISPVPARDGRKLYVIGRQLRGELMHYDSKSQEWRPYLQGISAEFLNFSHDGQWLVYVSFPEGTLWRSRIDGSDRQQLTVPPAQILHPSWSPDNKQIAFMSLPTGGIAKIYIVPANGGPARPVFAEDRNQEHPSWSPDGRSLIFSYMHWLEKTPPGVTLVHLDTGKAERLPGSEGVWEADWSPDGRYISARELNSRGLKLFDVKTQTWIDLVKDNAGFLRWSRDSRSVYFKRMGLTLD